MRGDKWTGNERMCVCDRERKEIIHMKKNSMRMKGRDLMVFQDKLIHFIGAIKCLPRRTSKCAVLKVED